MAEAYFEKVKYRLPQHPVIEAYVRPKIDYISRVVPLGKTTSLLDVGCGNGVFTYYFQQHSKAEPYNGIHAGLCRIRLTRSE